ncbi:hypothetical protein LTR09_012781 [Extremus antarcticus]|uniref:Uncharacterized protein n=1 Tax=Extremus antarcticus TaxID=702011 RepID=A0AAJ0G900_9PEZI|nr:hypothetical protein LTR09_012781 [Extremus antarcticus]
MDSRQSSNDLTSEQWNDCQRGDTPLEKPVSERRTTHKGIIYFALIFFILAVATLSSRRWGFRSPATPRFHDCGHTPTEARRRGCHFDVLSFAWQTPECYDRETTEAFRTHSGTWRFFADVDGEDMRTEDEALTGEYLTTFVTAQFHWTHCTYMWRQLHRAYASKGFIDEHLDNWNHTLHCQAVLLSPPVQEKMLDVNTLGRVIYPRCRKIW